MTPEVQDVIREEENKAYEIQNIYIRLLIL
jgi:hypothetical protein